MAEVRRFFLTNLNQMVEISKGEDDFWVASCVELKGCHSQGETIEEALENITGAIKEYSAAVSATKPNVTEIPKFSGRDGYRPKEEWLEG